MTQADSVHSTPPLNTSAINLTAAWIGWTFALAVQKLKNLNAAKNDIFRFDL